MFRYAGLRVSRAMMAEAASAAAPTNARLLLRFATPTSVLFNDQQVDMVLAPAINGEFGITANHSPTIAQLKPGVVQVINNEQSVTKRYFVSGGFAVVSEDGSASITAAEALPMEDLDREAVEQGLQKAESEFAAAADEKSKAIAQIKLEIHTTLKQAMDFFH